MDPLRDLSVDRTSSAHVLYLHTLRQLVRHTLTNVTCIAFVAAKCAHRRPLYWPTPHGKLPAPVRQSVEKCCDWLEDTAP